MARVRSETRSWDVLLLEAVAAVSDRLERLHPLIAEQENDGPSTGTIGRHVPESKEPWAMQAAGAYWDLYFGAGTVARAMRGAAGLHLPVFNDVHGEDALKTIRNMAPSAADWILRGATHTLEKLVRRADAVPAIDETEPWVPLPRINGEQVECPYCHTYGLRMLKRRGDVRCVFPNCHDYDGNPTQARMEAGRMTGEERLIFGDGTTLGGGA